jgi:two-component system C4-dicarboxylate transport response regulator DctD
VPAIGEEVRRHLLGHNWPGNVRELSHYAERVALGLADEPQPVPPAGGGRTLPERMEAYEAELIREALAATRGDVQETIEALGLPRKTFYDKLRRHGIDQSQYRKTVR